ncbi:pantoate--beta-alanine ligase [bacterium]
MKVIKDIHEMQEAAESLRRSGKIIGFVPTMGYLHDGHLSLIHIARKRADVVIISIFVNPTQFGQNEDLGKYPRDFKRDEKLAEEAGTDIIFYPSEENMYPGGYRTYVSVEKITEALCGASRPNHFRGVTTVCAKLFNTVKPHFAVFGQKDAQQAVVIQRMVTDLNLELEIVVGPIVREKDGLAMSSRNTYLTPDQRQDALSLYQSLHLAKSMIDGGERDTGNLIKAMQELIQSKNNTRVDYIQIVHPETLQSLDRIQENALIALAVFVGDTRLIDNLQVTL